MRIFHKCIPKKFLKHIIFSIDVFLNEKRPSVILKGERQPTGERDKEERGGWGVATDTCILRQMGAWRFPGTERRLMNQEK